MCMIAELDYIRDMGQSRIFYSLVAAISVTFRILPLMPDGLWSDKSGFRNLSLFAFLLDVGESKQHVSEVDDSMTCNHSFRRGKHRRIWWKQR